MSHSPYENKNVISRLFDADLWHVIVCIFRHLDGPSLESCNLVCNDWRSLIQNHVLNSSAKKGLTKSFKCGVATTKRIQLSGKFYAMKSDSTCIVVGLEDGQVELWKRVSATSNSLEVAAVKIRQENNAQEKDMKSPKYDEKALFSPPIGEYQNSRRRLKGLSGHTNLIKAVDLSPKWIVSGSWDGGVRLWRRSTGQCMGHAYPHCNKVAVTGVAINESEGWVLSSSRDGTVRKILLENIDDTDNTDKRINVEKGWFVTHRDPSQSDTRVHSQCDAIHGESIIDMSVDGNHFLTGGSDGIILFWDLKSCEPPKQNFQPKSILKGHGNGIRCVYLNGDICISGSRDRTARLWNVQTGKLIRVLTHSSDVRSVTFNSDVIITGDDYPDLFVWDTQKCLDPDVEDGASDLLLRTFTGHNGMVHSMQCTPTSVLTSDVTGLIIERDFWCSLEEGPSLRILRCSEGVNCMKVDDTSIACGLLNKCVHVYDRKTLKLNLELYGHTDHIWCIDMNSQYICTGSWDASVIVWSRTDGEKVYTFEHPDNKEISGVKIAGPRIYVSSLSGAVAVIEELEEPDEDEIFDLKMFVPSRTDLGEIYSMAADERFLLTGHTYASTSLQLWTIADMKSKLIIRENKSESIIWNLHLAYPLALVCRDNEVLDIYHLETKNSLKSLKHQSKVLNAALFRGIIVVGCQYGLMAFWNLHQALQANDEVIDINHPSCLKILTEHSGAISNVHIDDSELITDDYEGIVMLRKMKTHSYLKNIFEHFCDNF